MLQTYIQIKQFFYSTSYVKVLYIIIYFSSYRPIFLKINQVVCMFHRAISSNLDMSNRWQNYFLFQDVSNRCHRCAVPFELDTWSRKTQLYQASRGTKERVKWKGVFERGETKIFTGVKVLNQVLLKGNGHFYTIRQLD